ncbi:MAG: polysaccharide biosynthesis/export family protein [Ferruginibacter sp.]|nr:hypothetical protein [Ferruginibacter sp.]
MKNKYPHSVSGKCILYINVLLIYIAILSLSSCKVTSQGSYFKTLQKDTTLQNFVSNDYESKIIKGDKISISVSSLSPSEDAFFNNPASTSSLATTAGYLVQQDGTILLHRLGAIVAEGLTRKELSKKIENGLLPYTKEPIVTVNYLNHKITILGEVSKPQVLNMPEEQISIIDALVLSGDVTPNAIRNNITVIREEGNQKKVKHINLEDHSIFTSSWYYAKPNDIIIVAADNVKYVKEENKKKLQTNLSLVASVVSLVIIILSRIIK